MNKILLIFLCIPLCAAADPAADLTVARLNYDIAGAQAVVSVLEGSREADVDVLRVEANLLVAELLRIDFEDLPEDKIKERRALGKGIDDAADTGLKIVDSLDEMSEKYRLRADLIGTKIRSNYRAGKYEGEMNKAIDEALQRDPNNGRAHLSRAKTLILRPSPKPEQLQQGLEVLETALALDGTLEAAHLLQAYAHELLGNASMAIEIYQRCLQENTSCVPAARALSRPALRQQLG